MSLLRLAGRPLLASMLVSGGVQSVRAPEQVAPAADPVVRPLRERVTALPDSTEEVVRLNGAVQVAAGLLLATGRVPRVAALAAAVTLVPTTWAAHRFWEVKDPDERARQRTHFLQNVSVLGGLLIAAADTGGSPSLAWRGRHAAHGVRREARLVRRSVRATARPAATAGAVRAKLSR
ncbi:DoxX family membrane protein [Streptomyces sp. NPDC017936]|uniref:DoxX family membrane protein n=1 Tax=Streptomyces sp. NPDC017936 TaxID=3365016 RepID=UPI0037B7483A